MTPEEHSHDHVPEGATEAERRLAPGDLRAVQELINSHDLESHEDQLAEPDAVAAWLAERGLVPAGARFGAQDVARLHAVREGLRAVALTHNGGEADPQRLSALQAEAQRAPLHLRFSPAPRLTAAGDGMTEAIGRMLAAVARAEADGTWARFKACAADDCQWAFYDHSRNRSRSWCSMEVCGNRAKARAYRERGRRER